MITKTLRARGFTLFALFVLVAGVAPATLAYSPAPAKASPAMDGRSHRSSHASVRGSSSMHVQSVRGGKSGGSSGHTGGRGSGTGAHSGRHHGHGGGSYGHHGHRGYGRYYGFYGYPYYGYYGFYDYPFFGYYGYLGFPFFGSYWGGGYWPYSGYGYGPYRGYAANVGAIDLNVKPKKTQVFVNGAAVGKSGKYDGFPSYLWLGEGEYELIFYLDGYETVKKQLEVRANQTLDLNLHMQPGKSVPVSELSTAREENQRQREELKARYGRDRDRSQDPVRKRQMKKPPGGGEDEGAILDMRGESAQVRLLSIPPEAVVYIDDKFVGSGTDLAKSEGLILVDPGSHNLQVLRPGYKEQVIPFKVGEGQSLDLQVDLNKN